MTQDLGQLGKYRILAEIGKGGFATVYRALDTTLEREVALKVLDPVMMHDPIWVERFKREARAAARLKHSHVVTIYDIDEFEGRLYIAMELAEGPSLAGEIAARGRLPWDETLTILGQVAGALDYAHGQHMLHRDLKPANILLDPHRGALLSDFGFARLIGEHSARVSISGGIVGTPAYIAPEIWDDKEPSRQSDLYALGCILYEMLMGQVLFAGRTPMATMRRHDDGFQLPQQWPEAVPASVGAVLAKMLAQQPELRYGSAAEFIAALKTAPGSLPPPPVGGTSKPPDVLVKTPVDRANEPSTVPTSDNRQKIQAEREARRQAEVRAKTEAEQRRRTETAAAAQRKTAEAAQRRANEAAQQKAREDEKRRRYAEQLARRQATKAAPRTEWVVPGFGRWRKWLITPFGRIATGTLGWIRTGPVGRRWLKGCLFTLLILPLIYIPLLLLFVLCWPFLALAIGLREAAAVALQRYANAIRSRHLSEQPIIETGRVALGGTWSASLDGTAGQELTITATGSLGGNQPGTGADATGVIKHPGRPPFLLIDGQYRRPDLIMDFVRHVHGFSYISTGAPLQLRLPVSPAGPAGVADEGLTIEIRAGIPWTRSKMRRARALAWLAALAFVVLLVVLISTIA